VTRGHGVVSPLRGVALFEVGTALRAVLVASIQGDGGWQEGAKVQIGAELLCESANVDDKNR